LHHRNGNARFTRLIVASWNGAIAAPSEAPMTNAILHVTAIAGEARRNLDFYARTLGLRLVKKTANFDDPGTYHPYFGNEADAPVTIMTFFPWTGAPAGRSGVGEQDETAFRIPLAAMGFWTARLLPFGAERTQRFGETVLTFHDLNGLRLALVGIPGIETEPAWAGSDIPAAHALRGSTPSTSAPPVAYCSRSRQAHRALGWTSRRPNWAPL